MSALRLIVYGHLGVIDSNIRNRVPLWFSIFRVTYYTPMRLCSVTGEIRNIFLLLFSPNVCKINLFRPVKTITNYSGFARVLNLSINGTSIGFRHKIVFVSKYSIIVLEKTDAFNFHWVVSFTVDGQAYWCTVKVLIMIIEESGLINYYVDKCIIIQDCLNIRSF